MQFLCECMYIDCKIDCDARELHLKSWLGHQIGHGQHCSELLPQLKAHQET